MKIEFLYFEDCRNHHATLYLLKKVLGEIGLSDPVIEINISSDEMAKQERFLGSPSIRIDGVDIEGPTDPPENNVANKCRIYSVDGVPKGVPPEELITSALQKARLQEK